MMESKSLKKINLINQYNETVFLDSLRKKVKNYSTALNKSRIEYKNTHETEKREKK